MNSFTEYLIFNIPSRCGFVNMMHITAVFLSMTMSVVFIETERWLEKLAPHEPIGQYEHNKTGEDNADAHLKR